MGHAHRRRGGEMPLRQPLDAGCSFGPRHGSVRAFFQLRHRNQGFLIACGRIDAEISTLGGKLDHRVHLELALLPFYFLLNGCQPPGEHRSPGERSTRRSDRSQGVGGPRFRIEARVQQAVFFEVSDGRPAIGDASGKRLHLRRLRHRRFRRAVFLDSPIHGHAILHVRQMVNKIQQFAPGRCGVLRKIIAKKP